MKDQQKNESTQFINNPRIIEINNRRYRMNHFFEIEHKQDSHISPASLMQKSSFELDHPESGNKITRNDDGITLTLHDISPYYFRILHQQYSMVINSVATRCGVNIIIPKLASNDQYIILKSDHSNKSIQCVAQELRTIIAGIGINFKRTHFVNIPMESRELKKQIALFRDRVSKLSHFSPNLSGYLRSYESLHLTVCVLDLSIPEKLKYDCDIVQQVCSKRVAECMQAGPLILDLKGVDVMGDDYSRSTVLYAKVNETNNSNRLQTLCDGVITDLKTFGLIYPAKGDTHVLLHMTVLKTPPTYNDGTIRATFDATTLLQEFKDFRFGGVVVKSIHLCCLNETDPNTQYYRSLLNVKFFG